MATITRISLSVDTLCDLNWFQLLTTSVPAKGIGSAGGRFDWMRLKMRVTTSDGMLIDCNEYVTCISLLLSNRYSSSNLALSIGP